jgi:hypothetical protein
VSSYGSFDTRMQGWTLPDHADFKELWQERAAILEFDAGLLRADAEAQGKEWATQVVCAQLNALSDASLRNHGWERSGGEWVKAQPGPDLRN